MTKAKHADAAHKAWGETPPEWIVVLADQCDRSNQSTAAQRLGVSQSVVAETIRKTYKGSLARVEERVRGAFMGKTVDCPVLGDDLARDRCLDLQGRPLAITNPERVQLFRTCPTCPHYRGQKKAALSSKPEGE